MWSDPEVQTVLPGVHRAPVPLPSDGLRAVNVYVVEDPDGITLVDAGWDGPAARHAVDQGLAAAGATIADVRRIVVTHVHYDHVGQANALRRAGADAWWLGEGERASFTGWITKSEPQRRARLQIFRQHGGGPLVDSDAMEESPADPVGWDPPDHWTREGDAIALHDEPLEAVDTPGHTIGHQCFWHAGRRMLFAGDHVLPHITPSIGLEGVVNRMALADFLSSLAKVRKLDAALVLPAHGEVFTDLPGRVDQLVAHHDTRLDGCVAAVGDRSRTAYEVATMLPWTRRETAFADLDQFNQVLAVWETAAHLELLHARNALSRTVAERLITFGPPRGDGG